MEKKVKKRRREKTKSDIRYFVEKCFWCRPYWSSIPRSFRCNCQDRWWSVSDETLAARCIHSCRSWFPLSKLSDMFYDESTYFSSLGRHTLLGSTRSLPPFPACSNSFQVRGVPRTRLGMLIKTVFLLIQLVWYLPALTKQRSHVWRKVTRETTASSLASACRKRNVVKAQALKPDAGPLHHIWFSLFFSCSQKF